MAEARARGNLRQSLSKLHRIAGATIVESDGTMLALATGVEVEAAAPGTQWLDRWCESAVVVERPGVLMHALTLMADAARTIGDGERARRHVDRGSPSGSSCSDNSMGRCNAA